MARSSEKIESAKIKSLLIAAGYFWANHNMNMSIREASNYNYEFVNVIYFINMYKYNCYDKKIRIFGK